MEKEPVDFYDTQSDILDDIWSLSKKLISIKAYDGKIKDLIVDLTVAVEDLSDDVTLGDFIM